MNNNHEQPNIQRAVLERIRSGQLHMRPRLFFIGKMVLLLVLAGLVLLVSTFLASFIFFDIRLNGHESLLGFGPRGILLFLSVFPWTFAFFDAALVLLLAWLLRHFKFGYRKTLVFFLLMLGVVAGGAGLLFERGTNFHDNRYVEAERGELFFPFEFLYEGALSPAPEEFGLYRGFVVEVDDPLFTMTYNDSDSDHDDRTWSVLPPEDFDIEELIVGDKVYVAGDEDGGVIHAYGVRVLEH